MLHILVVERPRSSLGMWLTVKTGDQNSTTFVDLTVRTQFVVFINRKSYKAATIPKEMPRNLNGVTWSISKKRIHLILQGQDDAPQASLPTLYTSNHDPNRPEQSWRYSMIASNLYEGRAVDSFA